MSENEDDSALTQSMIDAQLEGAGMSAEAYKYAADLSLQMGMASLALQKEMWQKQLELEEPWWETGTWALGELETGIKDGRFDVGEFKFEFDAEEDPSYKWRYSEGLRALDQSAAARGGLFSGAQMKASQRYGQDAASQEYQNAFGRYTQSWDANRVRKAGLYNQYAGLSNTGQQSAQSMGGAGQNYANAAGNIYGQMGQQMGSAATGAANALSQGGVNAANTAYNAYWQNRNFDQRQENYQTGQDNQQSISQGNTIGNIIGVLGQLFG